MSAVPVLRLPRLDSDLDSSSLARPERRLATARLRREYAESRNDDYQDDKRLIRERTKFAEHMQLLHALKILSEKDARHKHVGTPGKDNDIDLDFSKIWQSQINKSDIPERPHHTRKLHIATPQLRQPICARNRSAAPMFRPTRVPFSADKEKQRMHFISKDWKSEDVSWIRFHKSDLKDIHKLGWI